jgi:hypothetical protein
LDRGKSGDIFIRVEPAEFADGYSLPVPGRPAARLLSNTFLSKDPIPGLDMFETTLIPFADLRKGEHPEKKRLNQLSVAFGQALIHDMTKARIGFVPSLIGDPDFALPNTDPLCQLVVETSAVDIFYFPCTATVTANANGTTTVTLSDTSRYTIVHVATWSYANGPFSITVPTSPGFHARRGIFPLGATLTPDDTNSTKVPINDATAFIDLSIIYGTSQSLNTLLRANDGSGKLLTAPDGDIPFGGAGIPNDCGAFDAVNNPSSGSGDARVDENLYLDFIHSLYFRSHNRDAEWVAIHHPELTTDEEIFQRARAINIARFQRQVYKEYLKSTFGDWVVNHYLEDYEGYDDAQDPRIDVAFDIAFRVAHSQVLLPPYIFDADCQPVTIEGILGFPQHSRPNCLFTTFRDVGGASIGKSAMSQAAQKINGKVSDLLRNIVFRSANGQNTAGFNLDIEMLNLDRSRRFGIPNFDDLRKSRRGESVYELPGCSRGPEAGQDPLKCFKYVTKNGTMASLLRSVYRHVDLIDAFIGLMLEDNNDNDKFIFGQTATIIILEQFARSRNADPFYFANNDNPVDFTHAEKLRFKETVAESIELSYGFSVHSNAFKVPKPSHAFCTF